MNPLRPVASYPKSGNTWIRLLMLAYEKGPAFGLNERPPTYTQDSARWAWEKVSPVPLEELTDTEKAALRPAVLVELARSVKGPVLLKTHAANVSIDGIPLMPPGLVDRALVVVRDPRDVAVSCADHFGVSIDTVIEQMRDPRRYVTKRGVSVFLSSWSLHVRSWQQTSFSTFTIRYEDLHRDPIGIFRRVVEFYGIEPDETRLRLAVETCAFEALRAVEDREGFVAKSDHQQRFFRQGRSGAWRDVLSPGQAARLEHDHHEAMASLNYEVS